MIKIQGPGFFATRNPPVVIHVIINWLFNLASAFQYFTKFFLETIVKIILRLYRKTCIVNFDLPWSAENFHNQKDITTFSCEISFHF